MGDRKCGGGGGEGKKVNGYGDKKASENIYAYIIAYVHEYTYT